VNRNLIWGWLALMGLFFAWTQYKNSQAKAQHQAFVADSLANVEKNPDRKASTHSSLETPTFKADSSGKSISPSALAASAAVADSTLIPRRQIRIETSRFTALLDNRGARLSEVTIPNLEGKPVHNGVLIRSEGEGALTLTLNRIPLDQTIWRMERTDTLIRVVSEPVSIVFSTDLNGAKITRTYTFLPDSPNIRHVLTAPEGAIQNYSLDWKGGLEETEKILQGRGIGLLSGYFSEVVYDNGASVQRQAFEGEKTFNAQSGVLRWVGMRRKYVAILLDFGKEIQDRVRAVGHSDPDMPKGAPRHYTLNISSAQESETGALDFDVVVLPLHYEKIKSLGRNYEQILFSGWESFFRADIWYVKLCGLVLKLLNMFYRWIPNYGVAIILLTLLVRFITMPLSVTQIKQAAKMAQHQPAIKKIQEKNKGDRQKTQMEIMAYYKERGINPLAPVMGCFPVLLQMPVFISLFNVLGRAVELHDTPFFGWIRDLSQSDVVLPALKIPFLFPVGLTILPFFMAGTMWLQMKLTIKDPNQKAMVWMMPMMMFVFSCSFPSGLVLYWTVSNLFTIAQTKVFTPKASKVAAKA